MEITYKLLTEEYTDQSIELLASTFRASEPITRALGITQQDFVKFIEIYTLDSVKYNLSVVAFDEEKNKVAGCTINRDYFAPAPDRYSEIPASFKPMQGLMKQLSRDFLSSTPKNIGSYFYLFIGGVLPEYSGNGINYQKAIFNEKIARENNFEYIIVEPTGPATQHIYLNKLGFEEIATAPYSDFIFDGKKVFGEIEDVQSCKLALKKL